MPPLWPKRQSGAQDSRAAPGGEGELCHGAGQEIKIATRKRGLAEKAGTSKNPSRRRHGAAGWAALRPSMTREGVPGRRASA